MLLRQHVDPDLIGGLKLRIGDELIDASVATQLKLMRRRLVEAGQEKARALAAIRTTSLRTHLRSASRCRTGALLHSFSHSFFSLRLVVALILFFRSFFVLSLFLFEQRDAAGTLPRWAAVARELRRRPRRQLVQ